MRKGSGSWQDNTATDIVEVACVEYGYCTSTENDKGLAGDLKTVEVQIPASDTNTLDKHTRYYRYYTSSTSTPYMQHMIKMVLGPEGTRGYDWAYGGDHVFDSAYIGASDNDLKPYAEQFLTYYSGAGDPPVMHVASYFTSGNCGCGGSGSDGVFVVGPYEKNSSFSGGNHYNSDWYSRCVVAQPDGTYVTYYVDQMNQPVMEVMTGDDPSVGSPSVWVTQYLRDSRGRTSQVRSPASISDYSHTAKTITPRETAGLVTVFTYNDDTSTPWLNDFVESTKWKEGVGTGQPENLVSTTYYTTRWLTLREGGPEWYDVAHICFRPFIASTWNYEGVGTVTSTHASPVSGSHETITEYSFYETTDGTDPLYIVPRTVTVTYQ